MVQEGNGLAHPRKVLCHSFHTDCTKHSLKYSNAILLVTFLESVLACFYCSLWKSPECQVPHWKFRNSSLSSLSSCFIHSNWHIGIHFIYFLYFNIGVVKKLYRLLRVYPKKYFHVYTLPNDDILSKILHSFRRRLSLDPNTSLPLQTHLGASCCHHWFLQDNVHSCPVSE